MMVQSTIKRSRGTDSRESYFSMAGYSPGTVHNKNNDPVTVQNACRLRNIFTQRSKTITTKPQKAYARKLKRID